MRKDGSRPLSVPKKRRDSGTRNYSAARNSTSARKNPIAVPFDPPSNGPKSIVGKMKSSVESTSQGMMGNSSGLNKTVDRRKTRHSVDHFEVRERNVSTRQSSRTLANKRKEKDIIEIDSDQEDNQESGEETPKPTLRKRRLIQPDNDSDDEGEIVRPSSSSCTSFNKDDDNMKRVANKLKNDREQAHSEKDKKKVQIELKARQDRQAKMIEEQRLKERLLQQQQLQRQAELDAKNALRAEYAEYERNLSFDEILKKEREEAIQRERERKQAQMETDLLKSRVSYEYKMHSSSLPSSYTTKMTDLHPKLDIPVRRTEPRLPASLRSTASLISPFIEKRPAPISLLESSLKTENFFNLPGGLKSMVRSARDSLSRKLHQQPHEYKEEKDIDIKSQPVVGDVFDYEEDIKMESPSITTTKKSPAPKNKSVEESVKIELPFDPIDDDPLKPIGSDSHLLTYPFEGKKSVTVYERDLTRLDEDQYLNDTLLDVFPKIWDDDYPTSKSTHTFSSFFYTKLAGDGNNVNYDKIGRWTANINIFEKSMIIIPVAQNYHWYLIVVTNPTRCIRNAEAYGLTNSIQNGDIDIDYVEEDRPPRVGRWKNQVPSGAMLNPEKAYIMLLDSLGGMKKETCNNISEYLKKEAMEKLNIQEDDFVEPEYVSAHCPTQKNFVDCGVFCLHYIRSLYEDPRRMLKVLYNHRKDDKGWDPENTLPVFRQILRRILKRKMVKYREYLTSKLKEEVGYC